MLHIWGNTGEYNTFFNTFFFLFKPQRTEFAYTWTVISIYFGLDDMVFVSSSAVSEFVTDRLKGFSKPKQTLVITQAVRLTRHVTGRQLVSLEETFTFLCHPGDV